MKVFARVVVFMSSATVKQLKTSRTDSRSKRLLVPVMVRTSDYQLDEPVGNLPSLSPSSSGGTQKSPQKRSFSSPLSGAARHQAVSSFPSAFLRPLCFEDQRLFVVLDVSLPPRFRAWRRSVLFARLLLLCEEKRCVNLFVVNAS